ncbi:MAG TPA: molecular chaperone DnaK [Anaeromyxobacteraceae bacterium]|nr:molecular chaperone DnaK [Anaeromyxobacteraceae bacterium]
MTTDHEPVIGIDLGTTNSVVAAVVNGSPRVIPNRGGQLLTPSIVAVAKNGKQLVGQLARRQAITNPQNTIHAAKRLIGRRWGSREVEDARKVLPYELVAGPGGHDVRVVLDGNPISVPEVSAMVLAELKADAEAFFGRVISRAVITVPAYFNDGQRQATRDAGRLAGLDVLRIVNEPTSAALAYGFGRGLEEKVVVFDLGGGTFDVSILDVSKSVFDVVAVGGDTYLGGEDFDRRVIDALVFGFARDHDGLDLRQDRMAMQRIRDAAERAKCELSTVPTAAVHLPFIAGGTAGHPALHLEAQLTREQLEDMTRDLVDRCIQVTAKTLKEAGLRPQQIGEVLLVGGQTRMPRVQQAVRELFGREPSRGVHPEEVVALGAAIQAQALTEPEASAAEVLLLDVTPRDLGIMVAGGFFQTVIPRNTTVPASQTHVFTTSQDYQPTVRISVLQGESELAAENELLGEFILEGLRSARRGEVEIEVAFDISADGIVGVSARDVHTGRQQSITVTATSGLTEQEIQQILAEGASQAPAPADESGARRRAALEAALEEIASLEPAVALALQRSRFGTDALDRAHRLTKQAREALASGDGQRIEAEARDVDRTLQLFRSLASGGGVA